MARFSGKVGYVDYSETTPGVYTPTSTEKIYYGDLVQHSRRWSSGEGVNDNIVFSQDISIVADPFMFNNLHNMRYVIFGVEDDPDAIKWRITSFERDFPRVRISLGDKYNGE